MSSLRAATTGGFAKIFGVPLALAAISAAGLVAALLFDGPADFVCVLAIATPLIVVVRMLCRGGAVRR